MSSWQLIFLQSRANNGVYDDGSPAYYWAWPRGTWLQERLRYLRQDQKRFKEPVQRESNEAQ